MMLSKTPLDRFSALAMIFFAGYAVCSVVDRVPELRGQVAVDRQVIAKVKVDEKKAAAAAVKAECEHKIMLAVIAAYNGVGGYQAPNCPKEIRDQVITDLTNVQW